MKKKFLFLLSIGLLTSCGNINVNNNNSSSLVNNVINDSEVSTSSLEEETNTSSSLINNENNSISDKAVSNMELIDFKGDLESLYVNFKKIEGVSSYLVQYKEVNESTYKDVDNMLIREYPNYMRVDIPGLKEGRYNVLIKATSRNNKEYNASIEVGVKGHTREGFGFVNGTSSGAYNDDGTLKDNAKVIYITKNNAKTVSIKLNNKTYTGFQRIIQAKEKDTSISDIPLCFRIIGCIDVNDLDCYLSSSEGLQIKGKNANSKLNITLEGIGEDACFNHFGLLIRNADNVEVRNLGFLNSMDDSVSVDTDNSHIWVHNCDLFYGQAGSDADQVKGDGAIDTKKSSLITHSYNHFFDTGKSNLQGMKSETTSNRITYHHNWYDHSDSRHPRVRTCTVHVYNNYFDGNAKYGVGATMGSSIFVENNYFRNCKYPMLISMQGNDIATNPKGTFSSEDGGMIKSFGNYIVGATKFTTYTSNNEFDAYGASSRDEKVPETITSKKGGNTYNNFDTDESMYVYKVDTPEVGKENVINYSGRINGGDLKFNFTSKDDSSYEVNTELKNLIVNYSSSLVSIQGEK